MLVKFLQLMQDTQSVELVGIIAWEAFLNMKEFDRMLQGRSLLPSRGTNHPLRRGNGEDIFSHVNIIIFCDFIVMMHVRSFSCALCFEVKCVVYLCCASSITVFHAFLLILYQEHPKLHTPK